MLNTLGLLVCSGLAIGPVCSAEEGLILDLDAGKGVVADDKGAVREWHNQAAESEAKVFAINDAGLRAKAPGTGSPTLKKKLPELNGHDTLVFENDELINMKEDVFDHLTQGSGYTWLVVIKPYPTDMGKTELGQPPLKDVNAFLGNLKNGGRCCGFWGCFDDDLTVWSGSRNDVTFGRFDKNNPKLIGLKLEANRYYVVATRMGAGTGTVPMEIFVDSAKPLGKVDFPVNPEANPSKLAIGTERDATNHPGAESFDGELARILIYERPLSDEELAAAIERLQKTYLEDK